MTIMRKMCKVKFPKLNLNKNKLVLARNIIKEKQKHDKKRQKKKNKFNRVTVPYSQISFFIEDRDSVVRTL